MLAVRDVMVQAQTGSGKTLAFLVPVIDTLLNRSPRVQRGDVRFFFFFFFFFVRVVVESTVAAW